MLAVALMLLTIVVYLPVWKAGFILDDNDYLTENPSIVGSQGLKEVWTTREARICPLVITSFWVGHALWGLNPTPYHVVNVLLHGLCALLFCRVLLRLGAGRATAWLAAALWTLHPVQVDTVAWISELKNTQSGLFYLLCILFFLKWRHEANSTGIQQPGRRRWYYALSLLFAVMALTSKSSTVVLPVVLGLCVWWIEGRWQWRLLWRLAPFFLFSALACAWSIWEQKTQGGIGGIWALSWTDRIIVPGRALWFYLGKLLWPQPLTLIYPRWELDAASVFSYLPTLAAALAFFLLWQRREGRLRPCFFAFAIFIVVLLPVVGLVDHFFLRYSYVGDHFQYLACMGPLALAASGIVSMERFFKSRHPLLFPGLVAGLLLILGVSTLRHAPVYQNMETLWTDTILKNPRSWLAHNNLGTVMQEKGRMEEAISHFRTSIQLNPEFEASRINLGNALSNTGRLEEAIPSYERGVAINPKFATGYYNYGCAFVRHGRLEEAIVQFQKALEIFPGHKLARNNLASALLDLGRPAEAVPHCQKIVDDSPDNPKSRTTLGNALAQSGQAEQAVVQYQKVLEIDPTYPDAQNNIGVVLLGLGRLDDALYAWKSILTADPDSLVAARAVAWLLATCPDERYRDGVKALELALRADRFSGGRSAPVAQALAAAYAETGQHASAEVAAERALILARTQGDARLAEQLPEQIGSYRLRKPWRDPGLKAASVSRDQP